VPSACPVHRPPDTTHRPPEPAVVIVDDSRRLLDAITAFVSRRGVSVVGSFDDAATALESIPALTADVVVIDLRMPGISGLDAIPRLREALGATGIVVMTFLDTPGYRRAAMAAGADEFVGKAAVETDLLPAIRRASRTAAARRCECPPRPGGPETTA